jgi:hypothetical protein
VKPASAELDRALWRDRNNLDSSRQPVDANLVAGAGP